MKNLNHNASGLFLIPLVAFFIIGCASEPVKVDFPVNHPANSLSTETAFTPPPNPFQNNMSLPEHKAASSSSRTNEEHPPKQQHQMTHQMPGMSHDSRSSQESEAVTPKQQHKEHNQ